MSAPCRQFSHFFRTCSAPLIITIYIVMVPRALHREQLLWSRNKRNNTDPHVKGFLFRKTQHSREAKHRHCGALLSLCREKKNITRRQSQRWSKGRWWGNRRKWRKGVMKRWHRKRRKKGMVRAKEWWQWKGPGRNRGGVAWDWTNRHLVWAAVSGQHLLSRLPAVQGAWRFAHPGAGRSGRYDVDLWLHLRTAPGAGVLTQHVCEATVGPRSRPPSTTSAFQLFPLLFFFVLFFFPFYWRALCFDCSTKEVSLQKMTAQLWPGKLDHEGHKETIQKCLPQQWGKNTPHYVF